MGDSDPPTPSNVEFFFVERVEIDFPFLILQADVDIQLLPPNLLNGFGNRSMALARVHENIRRAIGYSLNPGGINPVAACSPPRKTLRTRDSLLTARFRAGRTLGSSSGLCVTLRI